MKFAQVGYGSEGQGINQKTKEGYTYVVNDNMRTGGKLTPVATNWQTEKKFVTTGVILTMKQGGVIKSKDGQIITQDDLNRAYGKKELGVKNIKSGASGKFIGGTGDTHDQSGNFVIGSRSLEARAKSLGKFLGEKGLGEDALSKGPATQTAFKELKSIGG